jgi:2-polyprenyl-6-methoxyphenol hydroxylase-like FAD-dependent oxidoreductase
VSRNPYDAIVVGARCAGSPTAMLLARRGFKVLLVDKASFPSDTISTHLVHPPGVAALKRWGLLERVVSTGCPPIDTYAFDFGPFTISGSPSIPDAPVAYAPRRTVLDKILLDAALEAGAEAREGFLVADVVREDGAVAGVRGHAKGGEPVTERARVVIGADGLRSRVARSVAPEAYREKPPLLAAYYTYWRGLPMEGRFENYARPRRGWAAWPTNDGLTLLIVGWPYGELDAYRKDIEDNYLKTVALEPAFAERMRGATREEPFVGMAVPNYFRKPFGPGWALVGDAGYNKDFITAQGIADAFLDAERCAGAIEQALRGERPFEAAMADYQAERDARAGAMYELTTALATLEPPPPPLQRVLQALPGNQEAMDAFARMNGGAMSPAEFFSEENVGRILGVAS